MTIVSLVRSAALAAVVAAGSLGSAPAIAAPADVALLNAYLGTWKGTGKVTFPDGKVQDAACQLEFIDGRGDKINFRGRCALSGTAITMNGAMAYVDAAGSYESVMTTSIGFTGRAIGKRTGDQVRFDLASVGGDPSAENLDVDASFIMDGGQIDVELTLLFKDSGDRYSATAPLRR